MNNIKERQQVYRQMPRPVRRKQPNNTNNFLKSFIITLIAMCAVTAIIYRDDVARAFGSLADVFVGKNARVEFNLPFSPRRQNILVMGVDVAYNSDDPFKGNRSDTMLLVSIAPYGKNINIISIPRDSKVYISGKNRPDKINHAFAFGGPNLSVKTVEETFGVRIDHYIALSNMGLVKFIDTIGGLPIYIEKDMYYNDSAAGLHINLAKGERVLSGKETEGYLRFRKDALGDIGRIRRQQWFFNALMERVKDPAVLVKIPEVLKVMPKYILTDMSVYEMSQYAALAKSVDMSGIQVATLPGSPSSRGAISYWILDPDKTQEIINKLVYRDKTAMPTEPISAGILYEASRESAAKDLKAQLEQNGLQVKMINKERLGHDHIAIHNIDLPPEVISSLKKSIPDIKEKQTVYDPIGFNRAAKDFTVIMAGS